jgi:hypothetical protein
MHTLSRLSIALIVAAAAGACRPAGAPRPADEPAIVTRAQWGARAPVLPMQPHQPVRITVHHTGGAQDRAHPMAGKLRALQRFSQEQGTLADGRIKKAWADIPYHFYIAHDGAVGEGREVGYVGDSNTQYDLRGHVQVVLEGNFENEPVTDAQYQSLRRLVVYLARRYRVTPELITGHKDNAPTLCPGQDLYRRLPELRRAVAEGG